MKSLTIAALIVAAGIGIFWAKPNWKEEAAATLAVQLDKAATYFASNSGDALNSHEAPTALPRLAATSHTYEVRLLVVSLSCEQGRSCTEFLTQSTKVVSGAAFTSETRIPVSKAGIETDLEEW